LASKDDVDTTRLSSLHEPYTTGGKGDGDIIFGSAVRAVRSCGVVHYANIDDANGMRYSVLRKSIHVCTVVDESIQKAVQLTASARGTA
jgi:hypothetical protein